MRIAIPTLQQTPNGSVENRFGRAAFFAIYDTVTSQWSYVSNEQNLQAAQGAGIQAAQQILDNKANVLLAGSIGPKAMKTLLAGGVEVYQATSGISLSEILQQYQDKKLPKIDQANVPGHWV